MNIGVFVRSLAPTSPAEARFQNTILAGLARLETPRYRFVLLTQDVSDAPRYAGGLAWHALEVDSRWAQIASFFKLQIGGLIRFGCRWAGLAHSRLYAGVTRWMRNEPAYYKQLRELNVRLIWNINHHEMHTELPYVKTIWDVNHRVHCAYPEYSYARFGFDGLEHGLAYSLARASYVIVGTEEGKRHVTALYGVHASKFRVIPLPTPVLPQPAVLADQTAAATPYICYPARFWPHKNHVVIIEALKILRERWSVRVRCVFAGVDAGNLKYVLTYAQRAGVSDQVEYVGPVSDEEIARLYDGALALVYASAVGPDNLPPLEAMARGCPVITAEVPGAREQYGTAALFFRSTDEEELAQRIKELMDDPTLRQSLIGRGRERAARWTADDYVGAVVAIFDDFSRVARAWERCDSVFT